MRMPINLYVLYLRRATPIIRQERSEERLISVGLSALKQELSLVRQTIITTTDTCIGLPRILPPTVIAPQCLAITIP